MYTSKMPHNLPKKDKVFNSEENMAKARRQNIIGEHQLSRELRRLEREQTAEMRLSRYTQMKLKQQHAKQAESKNNKAPAEVVMYETHNPGFCYRRNGECRLQGSCIINSPVNMQDLRKLLFTNGEIDIDKVLCLFLLTAHKSESLRLPPKTQTANFPVRPYSPLERLIERSKKRSAEHELYKTLPVYILDIPGFDDKKNNEKDPRLANRILVNTKILHIIKSVQMALEQCNDDLLQEFFEIARSRQRLKSTMSKPTMVSYFKTLYGQNIISSCESFQLEVFPKEIIEVLHVDVEPLEDLVRVIRNYILFVPNSEIWKAFNCSVPKTKENDENTEGGKDSCSCNLGSTTGSCSSASPSWPSTYTYHIGIPKVKNIQAKLDIRAQNEPEFALPIDSDNENDEEPISYNEAMMQRQNKIFKNLQLGFSDYSIEDDDDGNDDDDLLSVDTAGLALDGLLNLLSESVKKEIRMEFQNRYKLFTDDEYSEDDDRKKTKAASSAVTVTTPPKQFIPVSHNLRASKCDACLYRWREPQPTPKISQLKKFPLPELKDTSYYSSKRARQISKLIDLEVKKLEEIECQCVAEREAKKTSTERAKEDIIEIIYVDEMELAKIRQEIKEKETAKKLKAFLEAKHC